MNFEPIVRTGRVSPLAGIDPRTVPFDARRQPPRFTIMLVEFAACAASIAFAWSVLP